MRLILWSLLLAVALLRLVVVPCLNAHKRHVRDPPPFPITLLECLPDAEMDLKTTQGETTRRTKGYLRAEERQVL